MVMVVVTFVVLHFPLLKMVLQIAVSYSSSIAQNDGDQ